MSHPIDWMQSNRAKPSNVDQIEAPSTTTWSTTVASARNILRNNNLSPEQGRVSKPARRRRRVSKRAPTTLLNTDPANFRAMVQQFTGCHATKFRPTAQLPSTGSSTALGFMQHNGGSINASANQTGGFHQVCYPSQVQKQQQQQQHVLMMNNMHGGGRATDQEPHP